MAVAMSGSSGDLLADRRFAWAAALAAEDDHAAAADLFRQVVEIVPAWAPGWCGLAEARRRMGETEAARHAWTRAAALDPDGRFGTALHLARLRGETPETMPDDYVRTLFDDYAPRFERHLCDALGYRGPDILMAALDAVAPGRCFTRALDLGCGTGLMGTALSSRVTTLAGIDLSPRMVEAARRTGHYADLTVASVDQALAAATPGAYGLVAAADVVPYLGELAPMVAAVARALEPGGLFAFTAQRLGTGTVVLGPDLRFAHSPGHVEAVLDGSGLKVLWLRFDSARRESGIDVPGLVAVACRVSTSAAQ